RAPRRQPGSHPVKRPALAINSSEIIALSIPKKEVRASQYASGQRPRQSRWSAWKRSGGSGGLGLLVHLPIPGKQVSDFVGGMIGQPGQHVSEPGLRIDVVHLAGFDQGIDGGGTMAAGRRTGGGPVSFSAPHI